MAIKIFEKYTPRANAPTVDYPVGSIKNESVPGANDGTPLDQDWGNDYAGFDAALFAAAGITPDGNPDTSSVSQRLHASGKVFGRRFNSIDDAINADNLTIGQRVIVDDYYGGATPNNSGLLFFSVVADGTGTVDGGKYIQGVGFQLEQNLRVPVNLKAYGGVGNDSTDNTTQFGRWLDYLIANNLEGEAYDGVYLIGDISKSANDGIKITGNATFKATGSNRLNMFRLTGVRGLVYADGITWDGNNIVARPFEIVNTGSAEQGNVYIGPSARFINAKNNAPDTFTTAGCYVQGEFSRVTFEGEVDGVDSTSTTGAVTIGLFINWSTIYYVRETVITSNARIRNVKNDNTVLADADGVQCLAPVDVYASLTVAPGATLENCKGRHIKSQVIGNSIDSPVIRRTIDDGLTEINLQYAGGHVRGAKIYHEGTRVNSVISVTQRVTSSVEQCVIGDNSLIISGVPSSVTDIMISTDVTDASVKAQGVIIENNRVNGAVEYMTSHRVANVIDVNRVIIRNNWAKFINTAYLNTTLFGAARAQLTVVFTDNECENGCTGGDITNDLIVEESRGNKGITALPNLNYAIAAGEITIYSPDVIITTEGGVGTDDLNTINIPDTLVGQIFTLRAQDDTRTVVVKNAADNIFLSGSDMSLNNTLDTLILKHDQFNDRFIELSRSDNGA